MNWQNMCSLDVDRGKILEWEKNFYSTHKTMNRNTNQLKLFIRISELEFYKTILKSAFLKFDITCRRTRSLFIRRIRVNKFYILRKNA